jgi:hypothetical protein
VHSLALALLPTFNATILAVGTGAGVSLLTYASGSGTFEPVPLDVAAPAQVTRVACVIDLVPGTFDLRIDAFAAQPYEHRLLGWQVTGTPELTPHEPPDPGPQG